MKYVWKEEQRRTTKILRQLGKGVSYLWCEYVMDFFRKKGKEEVHYQWNLDLNTFIDV